MFYMHSFALIHVASLIAYLQVLKCLTVDVVRSIGSQLATTFYTITKLTTAKRQTLSI